jgi:hypothetical protein
MTGVSHEGVFMVVDRESSMVTEQVRAQMQMFYAVDEWLPVRLHRDIAFGDACRVRQSV